MFKGATYDVLTSIHHYYVNSRPLYKLIYKITKYECIQKMDLCQVCSLMTRPLWVEREGFFHTTMNDRCR